MENIKTLEEIGYQLWQSDSKCVVYKKEQNDVTSFITFLLEEKVYGIELHGIKGIAALDIKAHKAIYQKMILLGWDSHE